MALQNVKRINVTSEQQLDAWLAKQAAQTEDVVLVTRARATHENFVSRDCIAELLAVHGWKAGRRFTINSDLLGHRITKRR